MKKDKHILINVNEDQFSKLEQAAKEQERTITNLCYLIIKKEVEKWQR